MKVEEIDYKEYSKLFFNSYIPYNTVDFNLLNSFKCDSLEFVLLHGSGDEIGIISGVKDSKVYSPFSAPFSFFSFNKFNVPSCSIIDALNVYEEFCINRSRISMSFVLPPNFYYESLVSKMIYSFFRCKFTPTVDENHYFRTCNFIKYETGAITKGVRYNLRAGEKAGLVFVKGETLEEFKTAYDIISRNKEFKDRPLKMSCSQLLDMKGLVDIDYFNVSCKDEPVASSIVYVYSSRIVHIVYWGDLPDSRCFFPMNFLAKCLFKYYLDQGVEIVDMGISSENGEPNVGLSRFKESIGCSLEAKFSFNKDLSKQSV